MSNHIFSFHKVNEGVDFFTSHFYRDKQINAIPDPEGGNTKRFPTSIPSPFAIIDLVATAFSKLSNTESLTGNLIYEKIVSQSLDVGTIFFNAITLKNKINIIHWKRNEQIEELLASPIEGHRILGNTLKMYLNDDALAYNFAECNDIYLVNYNHNFLGGTSPKTLFFSSLNPLEEDNENHINLGDNDILFDEHYCPLYKRSNDFQLFIYRFIMNYNNNAHLANKPIFSSKCKELFDYLERNKIILKSYNRELFEEISKIAPEDYNKYYQKLDTGKVGSYVKILNTPIGTKAPKTIGQSDFMVASNKLTTNKKPLVLFPGFGGQNLFGQLMIYFDHKYSKAIDESIPYYSETKVLNDRELPGMTGIRYPYLLVDDLLEDTLFRTQTDINELEFYDSNFKGDTNQGYLCPIKKDFFQYFDTDDLLLGKMEDGKPFFELEKRVANSIVATLRIPVNKGYITLTKTYLESGKIDRNKNVGEIINLSIDVNIFPFIKYDPNKALGNQESEINEVRTNYIFTGVINLPVINYIKNDGSVLPKIESKLKGEPNFYSFKVDITNENYDFAEIKYNSKSCLLIPKWIPRKPPSNIFHFAIDFGTTNTHIEYRVNNQESKPFTLTSNVFGRLSKNDKNLVVYANKEFVPEYIDPSSNFKFYQRSAVAVTKSLDYRQPVYSLADIRIPFHYESDEHTLGTTSDYHTNLKWSNFINDSDDEVRVKAFLEQLIIMIKAKVLSEEGKLKDSRFTWFFPSSMLRARISMLEKLWIELLSKHFYIPISNISKISESIAPFAYYMERERIDSNLYPAVTIDIGGGTSDLVIFKDDVPRYLSSFRYAANSVFGDSYNSNPSKNGFVNSYLKRITELLEANKLKNSLAALASIKHTTSNSADIIAFFMSLEGNSNIKDRFNISFQTMLVQDSKLKTVILLFYHSLIYHLASFIKNEKLDIPGVIVFSGNGGKLISILDQSINYQLISEFTTLIFKEIYNTDSLNRSIEIKLNIDPKAVTCKGGLYISKELNVDQSKITKILVGTEYEPLTLPKYPELRYNEKLINSVVDEVETCINLFFVINEKFNYTNNFTVNAGTLAVARKYLETEGKIKQWLLQGINRKMKELKENVNVEIEETLFFYPFIGVLNELADIITAEQ